jgi:uncharacterized Zn finger protein
MSWDSDYEWRRYVTAPERRRQAARKIARLKKAGREVAPVEVAGRKIAATFWGVAWCENLEAYSDYSNRLPRGRTYLRNGSVIDLQIETRRVRALVSGSEVYEVAIGIEPLPRRRWAEIKSQCAGQIDSLVELLQGSISERVMEIVSRKRAGLFPSPREIALDCSCPDWAEMCKHVAATLYGVGARLDRDPELLFTLRGVDPAEMVEAAIERPARAKRSRRAQALASDELSSVFGVDIVNDVGISEAASEHAAAQTKTNRRAVEARRRASPAASGKGKPASKRKQATRSPKKSRKKSTKRATSKTTAAKKKGAKKAAAKKSATRKPRGTAGDRKPRN